MNHFTHQEASAGFPVVEARVVMNSLMDYQAAGHQIPLGWCLVQVVHPIQNWGCRGQTVSESPFPHCTE